MTFDEAEKVVLPFGKHKGKTIDEVATADDGLRYLDWLRGEGPYGKIGEALDVYLSDSMIARELEQMMEGR